jgi:hypothetical protein
VYDTDPSDYLTVERDCRPLPGDARWGVLGYQTIRGWATVNEEESVEQSVNLLEL